MGGSWLAKKEQQQKKKVPYLVVERWAERGWGFCDWHRSITRRGEANEAGYGLLKA